MWELLLDWISAILFVVFCLLVGLAWIVLFFVMSVGRLIDKTGKLWDLALGVRTQEED